ncbi:DeoR/GlpR transcriptional regulator [Mesorhizobium sp. M4A.F.Ca.ET.020.02.1.1]|uniref:DeoR/GlpR family DNA-binding transcription regulator n=1 Tax=unclassified Mesorhizobium TaxID=325217 RepID=UPI000FD2174F|nr:MULTISPECIES: DeoR/GlpR family DNA-binding transcription regulator [unclassified Mesorhizobium]RVD40272.1 DeoR/GlpR transcriptional regulator [Mesorhizobium sp. M4A.F.Ca.ET.020.02.1.1]RWC20714.1 MAG: DeoR/GlpR transcriptional regulator [Mesorhizobium sp.]
MKSDSRRQGVVDFLMEAGTASVEDLAARFGVSKMTVHRDLDELEENGFLRKVRGGASIQPSGLFESDFRYRQKQAVGEKLRLAAAAVAMIEPGQTVIIDDGSTAGGIAGHLADLRPLTVISNNLAVIQDLAGVGGITLIALGGQYSKKFHGFFGLLAEETLKSLRADVAFLSSSAIHGSSAFHQDQEVVQTKRLMMAAAGRKYLLVDHGKFGRTALHFLTDLKAFDAVFTGSELGQPVRDELEATGVSLTVVDGKE